MPAPTKGTELLDLVRKSGLLDQPKIDGYVTTLQKDGQVEEDPTRLASRMVKDGLITVFQARQMLRGRYRGFFLGKYKVLEPIGSGGMADVYLCEHMTMRHKVAVKILPIEKLSDPSLLGRFRREAQAIATLNHINVVRAFDLDNEGNLHYLVTEYVDGCNLQEFIKKNGPMAPERAANCIAQAAAGLQHIAEADLVHRDIKPGNLLLDRSGVVKLLDLGLARFNDIERQDNLTRDFDDGRVLGTADYIAPEQGIKGSEVDIRADIYSLGATFYFLLKGEAPYEGATVTQKLLFHQIKEPPPLPDHVPAEIAELIKHMMVKKPADRVQTPAEVIERLMPFASESVAPLEEEMPPRSLALGAQPKSAGPRSSSRLSGKMAMTAMAHQSLSSASGRLGPRSGIDPALRATPHAGVNIPTIPNQTIEATMEELEGGEDEVLPIDRVSTEVESFISRYRWALLGGAVGVVCVCLLFVYILINATENIGIPIKTRTFSKIALPEPEEPIVTPTTKAEENVKNLDHVPKWIAPSQSQGELPAKSVKVTSSGAAGTHKTIKSALLSAGSNSTIVIMDSDHKEQLNLDGTQGIKNVTIQGWPANGKQIVWTFSATDDATKPLITLSNIENLTIKNLVLKGNGKRNELLSCSGTCPGLVLENVGLANFSRRGLNFNNTTGTKELPIRLIQIRSQAEADVEAAVHLEGLCKNIMFDRCRLDGPFRGAIAIAGSISQVEFKYCRFARNGSSIQYISSADSDPVQLKISNCVFFNPTEAALSFAKPLPQDNPAWEVTNNLFLSNKRIAQVKGSSYTSPNEMNPEWIWSDDGQTNSNTVIKPCTRYFRTNFVVTEQPSQSVLHVSGKERFVVWLNGKQVGASETKQYNQRVYRFDVSSDVKTGMNILAIEVTQENTDPLSPNEGSPAGLAACLRNSEGKIMVVTDSNWKVSREPFDQWNSSSMNNTDTHWEAAKPWVGEPVVFPWKYAVWDESIITSQSTMPKLKCSGNIRDYQSWEGYPFVNAVRGLVDAQKSKHYGMNPEDDATYLRYPRSFGLMRLGTKNDPVGYPQEN